MHRQKLLEALSLYRQTWVSGLLPYRQFQEDEEADHCTRLETFIREHSDCFERSCRPGHVTASALVCSPRGDEVLLLHHAKLRKWLQLGGHTDGSSDCKASALREAWEESGSQRIRLVPLDALVPQFQGADAIFDLDIHGIPARGSEPEHFHYDLRYLCSLDKEQKITGNHESTGLRWFSLADARELTQERSMLRQFDKLEALLPFLREPNLLHEPS